MNRLLKILTSKIFLIKIFFYKNLSFAKAKKREVYLIENLLDKYAHKKKIVVLCNGPSANLFSPCKDDLYLVTNSGSKLVNNLDFLYYVNDSLYIQKILAIPSFLKKNAEIIFYYNHSLLHKKGLKFLTKNISLINEKKLYFVSSEMEDVNALKNYNDFIAFYEERSLKVKIQNSGMFILLLGYYVAKKLNLPLEIYGLDMGEGGVVHFDGKGVIGDSVIEQRVKKNVKIYLDYIYAEYSESVKNHSYFNSNLT